MTTINISDPTDRQFVEEHENLADDIAAAQDAYDRLDERITALTARRDALLTERDRLGDLIRRGLVRYKPALDAQLEAQITLVAVERDGQGDIINFHTNAEATAFRNA